MSNVQEELRSIRGEVALALMAAVAAAFTLSPAQMKSVDEMLVTFLSIVVGAALPGVALTAAAPRPRADTKRAAEILGLRLESQVRFWFGYLLFGGLAVASVILGRAMDWSLPTPRLEAVPNWIPSGGAWLIGSTTFLTLFAAIRLRRIVDAVIGLVRLGTTVHAAEAEERRRELHQEVAEHVRRFPPGAPRGAVRERRDRA